MMMNAVIDMIFCLIVFLTHSRLRQEAHITPTPHQQLNLPFYVTIGPEIEVVKASVMM